MKKTSISFESNIMPIPVQIYVQLSEQKREIP
jgi:hypothetical protein